jgi:hypothetical protein
MLDQTVTLKIMTGEGKLRKFTSDIRVFNSVTNQASQIKQLEYTQSTELSLGKLNDLQDSLLLIDTFVHRSDSLIHTGHPTIKYEIRYGLQVVEQSSIELHFIDNMLASLGFRFRFCPRHPFC